MRLPNAVHESGAWRIRDIAPDFRVEDVWALPVRGDVGDFQALLDLMVSAAPRSTLALPARALWCVRDLLGRWVGLGRISTPADPGSMRPAGAQPIPGTQETSLADRLPADLRDTAAGPRFEYLPFVTLYRADQEFAAETSNRTVHAVLHLAWVDQGGGRYRGQMAVYVKPRGRLGHAYMGLIRPFRYWIVYPALMRQIERSWSEAGH